MKTFGVILGILFLVAMVVLWPLTMIWAVNTLFPLLSIPYSFLSWLAVCVLNISTFGGLNVSIKSLKNSIRG